MTVGPDYVPPEVKLPEKWNAAPPGGYEQEASGLSTWWEQLGDPLLTDLVKKAVEGNNDLRTAVARVRESRAVLGISRAGQYPGLDASASARKSHRDVETDGVSSTGDTDSYSAGLDASWEVDLFGGRRRSVEAAMADLSAQEESLRAVQVSLAAEVALTYVKIREYQRRTEVTKKNLDALREEAGMVRIRRDSGLTSDLDLAQAEEALASTESQLPSLHAGLNVSLNSMAILLGMQPGAMNEELSVPAPVPSPPARIAATLPADLLRRRPDIRLAERRLAAETARVGVAASELYPKLSLSGSFVYEDMETDSDGVISAAKGSTTGFGPTVRWPVFRAGAIRRNMEAQDARQEQALIAYEQTVLTAMGEVENSLRSLREFESEASLLRRAVVAARQAEELQAILYRTGLEDFESLLTARKNLLQLEDRLASSEASVVSELIRLYKALGGGWSPASQRTSAGSPAYLADTHRRPDR